MDNDAENINEDKSALVEKILKDIDNVMTKNADLIAFDIVPVEVNIQNKSPVLYLERCLGLEAWCVKHVYMYCYTELKENYLTKRPKKPKLTVENERLLKLLNVTILLNPDMTTLWNRRRELVLSKLLDKTKEFRFTRMVLARKPKCNDAYSYRRWLIENILIDDTLDSEYIENLIFEELYICAVTITNCPNNYHSWNHRMWTVNRAKQLDGKIDMSSILIAEYIYSKKQITDSVSDYSCYHYRQFCVKNIYELKNDTWEIFRNQLDFNIKKCYLRTIGLNPSGNINLDEFPEVELLDITLCIPAKNCNCNVDKLLFCRKFELLFFELALNDSLVSCYPRHETLWYHRRFIIHEIMTVMYEYYGLVRENGKVLKYVCKKCYPNDYRERQVKMGIFDASDLLSSIMCNVVVQHEKNFIEEMKDKDVFTVRHEKYMEFVLGLRNVM